MRITKKIITVKELTENYSDDGDNGVYGFNGKLCIRPEYQRSFVYSDKKRDMVLDTVRKGFPLGLMYWNLKPDGNFECLDGQLSVKTEYTTITIVRIIFAKVGHLYFCFCNLHKLFTPLF